MECLCFHQAHIIEWVLLRLRQMTLSWEWLDLLLRYPPLLSTLSFPLSPFNASPALPPPQIEIQMSRVGSTTNREQLLNHFKVFRNRNGGSEDEIRWGYEGTKCSIVTSITVSTLSGMVWKCSVSFLFYIPSSHLSWYEWVWPQWLSDILEGSSAGVANPGPWEPQSCMF